MRASDNNVCVIDGGDKRRGERDGHCVGDGRCKTNFFCRIVSPTTQSLFSSSLNNPRPSKQLMRVIMCNTFESLTRDGPKQPELDNKEGTKPCLQPPQAGPIFVYIYLHINIWFVCSLLKQVQYCRYLVLCILCIFHKDSSYISKGLLLHALI